MTKNHLLAPDILIQYLVSLLVIENLLVKLRIIRQDWILFYNYKAPEATTTSEHL